MNVAVVVLDTLRKDAIAPYDDGVDHTEHLAAFADEATVYDNAVAQAPWSLPSQVSLLTGRYPWQHGAGQSQPYVPPEESLLQERFRAAGYRTAAIHENTWLVPGTGAMRGFDTVATPADGSRYGASLWRALHRIPGGPALARRGIRSLSDRRRRSMLEERSDTTALVERTRRFLGAHGDDDFFLYLNPVVTHYPYVAPTAYADAHGVERSCADLSSAPVEYGGSVVSEELDALDRLYAATVDYLDDVFGRLVECMEAHGVAEDTLFVVVADHGELLGEDDRVGHHFSARPELTDVPLLIREPGGVGGGREATVTEVRGLFQEVLRRAGLPATDDERLVPGRAAGRYESPAVYRAALGDDRSALDAPRFYHVGRSDRVVATGVGGPSENDGGVSIRDLLGRGPKRPDPGTAVPDLDSDTTG